MAVVCSVSRAGRTRPAAHRLGRQPLVIDVPPEAEKAPSGPRSPGAPRRTGLVGVAWTIRPAVGVARSVELFTLRRRPFRPVLLADHRPAVALEILILRHKQSPPHPLASSNSAESSTMSLSTLRIDERR